MPEFTMEAATLRAALTTALTFMPTDSALPVLNGVNVTAGDGTVDLTATDRFIASCETVKVAGEPFGFLLAADVAKRLLTFLPKGTRKNPLTGMVTFTKDEKKVTAKFIGDVDLSMTFEPDRAEHFPSYDKLAAKVGEDEPQVITAIHFNPGYVARVMRAVSARDRYEPVRMSFTTPTKPLMVTHGEDYKAMVMPVRVRDDERRAA